MNNQMKLTEVVPNARHISSNVMTKNEFLQMDSSSVLQDRIREFGPEKLLTEEYMAIMTGIDVEKLRGYIWKYGITELVKVADSLDISSQQRMRLLLLYETCRRIGAGERNIVKVTSPEDASKLFIDRLRYQPIELFLVAYLDNRNHVIIVKEFSRGTTTECLVNHGMIVKDALNHGASGAIISHGHPSGIPEPSGNDKSTTTRLKDALHLVGIQLLDHIIVGGNNFISMKEEGLL